MFHTRLRQAACIAAILALSSSLQGKDKKASPTAAGETTAASARLHKLFDEYWEMRLRRDPERATYLGDHRYDDQVTDYSEAARLAELDDLKRMLHDLDAIPRHELPPDDQLNARLFDRVLREPIELAIYPEHLMPIKQQDSPQIALGMIKESHPFATRKDCENYAARLKQVPRQMDDMKAQMQEGMRRGVVRPKIIIEESLAQFDALIASDPKDSPLYAPAKKLSDAQGGDAARKAIEDATRTAMHGLSQMKAFLHDKYLPGCRESVGYGELPDGKAWYRRLAQYHTTTTLTPEEIHQIGLDEVKRIQGDMAKIAKEVGFEGDVRAFIEQVRNDPAQYNKSADELMRRHREILARSDANLPKLFGVLPKTPYELKAIEPFRAPAAPMAYYYNAPDDGSRPAYFYINTYKPETRPIYTMESLAYHEAMPGHHLQLSIAQEKKGWPAFRRFEGITAFIEGWGLYSELLGDDLGGYRDPYSRFGQLTFEAWRAARLVVDTGMHEYGWTRDRAIQYMKDNTAMSEPDIIAEIDRYIAWPGQALAYKIGQMEILRLRAEAKAALGDRFDIRAFHDHLLAEGSLPLSLLRERMTRWSEGK